MIRKRIGSFVVHAYPAETRRRRGAEMVDTLLDASDDSNRSFVAGCLSLVRGGLNERGRDGTRLTLAGLLALAGGVSAAAVLLGGGSGPMNSGPRAWMRAQARAFTSVSQNDRACRADTARLPPVPRMLRGAPTAALTSHLGVLRQPTPADARVSATYVRQLHIAARGVYIRYARHGAVDGVRYYLLPATHVGGEPLPGRCYTAVEAAFQNETDRYTAAQHQKAIRWERRVINEDKGQRLGVVVVTLDRSGRSAEYITADQLRTGRWGMEGGYGNNNLTMTTALLPDSVASVTARYAAQTYPGRVPRPVTVTRRVSDNLVVFVFRGAWDPPKLTYHSASGAVMTPRAPGAA